MVPKFWGWAILAFSMALLVMFHGLTMFIVHVGAHEYAHCLWNEYVMGESGPCHVVYDNNYAAVVGSSVSKYEHESIYTMQAIILVGMYLPECIVLYYATYKAADASRKKREIEQRLIRRVKARQDALRRVEEVRRVVAKPLNTRRDQ